jgi:hypothetical protein
MAKGTTNRGDGHPSHAHEVATPEDFLRTIEEITGQSLPVPEDLAPGECPICRAMGIDPERGPHIIELPEQMTLVTRPLPPDPAGE